VVHYVSPSAVIDVHGEDINVLGQLFHLFEFSVIQVWSGPCNHVLQLRDSISDLILFQIGWGHQRHWLTV
jgi:hypothetical protein